MCPELVVVPSGEFTMGSPDNEPERDTNETQVKIVFARPFAVGRFAVTRGEFEAFAKATGYKVDACDIMTGNTWTHTAGKSFRDPGFAQDDRHPVVCINFDDAKQYIAWLAKTTGKDYRLLSDSEREYVTRAGTTTPFWWGHAISPTQANYDGSTYYKGGGLKGEYRKRTVTVDTFPANAWGLYNVHGNVWELTQDCWNDSNEGNPGDGSARDGDCERHVVRGGSWWSGAFALRAAYRGAFTVPIRYSNEGFRVARSLTP
jgi:formylglycine-generating enzyme required for sulfatase activity